MLEAPGKALWLVPGAFILDLALRRYFKRSNPRLKVLRINGASGSGKTTLAESLDDHCENQEILARALSCAERERAVATLVIDCQIRPSAIEPLMKSHSIEAFGVVLLDCPRGGSVVGVSHLRYKR